MQLTLTDTQLEKQPLEYENKTVTLYHSLLNFLKYNEIPFTDSKGLIEVTPKDEHQTNLAKKFFITRRIEYTVKENE